MILGCFSVSLRLLLTSAWSVVSLCLKFRLSTGLSASLEIMVLTAGCTLSSTCRGTIDLMVLGNQVECFCVK